MIGAPAWVRGAEGAAALLEELGCRVRIADLWESLEEDPDLRARAPTAILVEAGDQVDAGRASVQRLRAVPALRDVPLLLACTVDALPRVRPDEPIDDLVLMPYVPIELYARIRRAEWRRSDFEHQGRLKLGPILIDLAAHEVSVNGLGVTLTHQEFALLRFLAENRGRVFSRQQLLERVWGVSHYAGSRTVDIHVRRLRMKLGKDLVPIETVRGVGYKMKHP